VCVCVYVCMAVVHTSYAKHNSIRLVLQVVALVAVYIYIAQPERSDPVCGHIPFLEGRKLHGFFSSKVPNDYMYIFWV